MRVSGLDHIVLNVRDVERSLSFYHECLGLPTERVEGWRRKELPFPSVRLNESTIIDLVAAKPDGTRTYTNLAHFCLVTDSQDVAGAAAELQQAGVAIEEGPIVRSGARGNALSIYFRDPDENLVELRSYTVTS